MHDKLAILLATIVGALLTLPILVVWDLLTMGWINWPWIGSVLLAATVTSFVLNTFLGKRVAQAWDSWKRRR